MSNDLGKFNQFEKEVRSGEARLYSDNWRAPILAAECVWDITEGRLVRDLCSDDVVCRCFFDVVDRRHNDFIQFIVSFEQVLFERGDYSLDDPQAILLRGRTLVREHLSLNRQRRAFSRARYPVWIECEGR